ncbi:MAG: hypothetical protein PHD82_06140 [Candidatus Riflebacteria bacterium]|nr:hypothetical protein [Candidatus Riflebacteria bacterium]
MKTLKLLRAVAIFSLFLLMTCSVSGISADETDGGCYDRTYKNPVEGVDPGPLPDNIHGVPEPESIPLDEIPADVDCEIDLVKNRIGIRNLQAIKTFIGPVNGQAVVKLTLDPKTTEMVRARIEILYGENTSGWTLNISDSVSNNGYGGDGGHQSRDGEAQILEGNLAVYGDDFMASHPEKGKVLASANGLAVPGSTVTFEVSDNRLVWQNDRGIDGAVTSPHIFSLDGQEDREGPVNHDIFIGFNQVVSGGRTGCGVTRIRIRLFPSI